MGTLTGPFFNHLIGSSSTGFTELILTGEGVEAGIKSGKIQGATPSDAQKIPHNGKKESNAVTGQKSRHDQHVGAILISNPTHVQQRQSNGRRVRYQESQYTNINMPLSQALQHLLKLKLITLKDPPQNPDTASSKYNPSVRCAYHSDSPGHDTDDYWTLKNKIQELIDAKEIEFDPPETPNVITALMTNH